MGLLTVAITPGLAICFYIYHKDKYNKEPIGLLIWSFIRGMLSILPAIIIQLSFKKYLGNRMGEDLLYTGIFSFFIIEGYPHQKGNSQGSF